VLQLARLAEQAQELGARGLRALAHGRTRVGDDRARPSPTVTATAATSGPTDARSTSPGHCRR
jgi:hypothetical protein